MIRFLSILFPGSHDFLNVGPGQTAGREKTGSLLKDPVQKRFPFLIQKRYPPQIQSTWSTRILRTCHLPTPFSFANGGPGKTAFQLQGDHCVFYVSGNSEHDLIPFENS
jgi:hypothetical protein